MYNNEFLKDFMIEIIGKTIIYNNKESFVYKIILPSNSVFMRFDKPNKDNNNSSIVIVDSKKFFLELYNGSLKEIIIDEDENKKFADANDGFSRGKINPVPLSEVRYNNKIDYQNGITRNKWLFMNGAVCFPIILLDSTKSAIDYFSKLKYNNWKINTLYNIYNNVEG